MTDGPHGSRGELLPRAWRRRLLRLLLLWVAVLVFTALLGTASGPRLAVILLAAASILWYLLDHGAANRLGGWQLVDEPASRRGRGDDFRTTHLAERLAAAQRDDRVRAELRHDLHAVLATIVHERLWTRHGITVEEEPAWARSLMPPELWQLVTGPAPARLDDPDDLDRILRRIEQW